MTDWDHKAWEILLLQIVKTPGRERDLGAVGLESACPEDTLDS